jgi:predicted DNA-binding transcriptional regulator AlpA
MNDISKTSQRRIVRGYKAVAARVGKSPVQIWRDVKAGTFPAPIVLGPNSVGWYDDELVAYVDSRPRVNYAPPVSDVAEEPSEVA